MSEGGVRGVGAQQQQGAVSLSGATTCLSFFNVSILFCFWLTTSSERAAWSVTYVKITKSHIQSPPHPTEVLEFLLDILGTPVGSFMLWQTFVGLCNQRGSALILPDLPPPPYGTQKGGLPFRHVCGCEVAQAR